MLRQPTLTRFPPRSSAEGPEHLTEPKHLAFTATVPNEKAVGASSHLACVALGVTPLREGPLLLPPPPAPACTPGQD